MTDLETSEDGSTTSMECRPRYPRKCKAQLPQQDDMDETIDEEDKENAWAFTLSEKISIFLTCQDNELGKLDWTFQTPSIKSLNKKIEKVTPGGAGRVKNVIHTSGPLDLSVLFQHLGCKDDRKGEPGDDSKADTIFAMEFAAHPLTTPQYINETWKMDSLNTLQALIHQLNRERGAYISKHNLYWRTLTNPEERQKHEGRLFCMKIQQAISRPTNSLWTAFMLGCTWDYTFQKLKVCRAVYSLVNKNAKHSMGKHFKCGECDNAARQRCTCMNEDTHAEQKIFVEELMDRVFGEQRESRKKHKDGWHTVPLYVRDAHFFKQYPRLLLLTKLHVGESEKPIPCSMSNFRKHVFRRVNELVNKSQVMRTWFQWNPCWFDSEDEATYP